MKKNKLRMYLSESEEGTERTRLGHKYLDILEFISNSDGYMVQVIATNENGSLLALDGADLFYDLLLNYNSGEKAKNFYLDGLNR